MLDTSTLLLSWYLLLHLYIVQHCFSVFACNFQWFWKYFVDTLLIGFQKLMQLPTVSESIELWDFLSVDSQVWFIVQQFPLFCSQKFFLIKIIWLTSYYYILFIADVRILKFFFYHGNITRWLIVDEEYWKYIVLLPPFPIFWNVINSVFITNYSSWLGC
jgi:hypothetical protein